MEKNATKMLHFPLQPGQALDDIYHHHHQCRNRGKADQFYTKKLRAIPVLFLRFVIKQSYIKPYSFSQTRSHTWFSDINRLEKRKKEENKRKKIK